MRVGGTARFLDASEWACCAYSLASALAQTASSSSWVRSLLISHFLRKEGS